MREPTNRFSLAEKNDKVLALKANQRFMINSKSQTKEKPPCAICHVMRRVVLLAAALAFFAFFAYSPELRKDVRFADLLQYFSLENVLFLMCAAIAVKLAFSAAQEFFKK